MPSWLPILSGRHYLLCLELQARCNAMVIVLMGTLTGVGGGVIRDILTNQVPFILRQDIYATAAIAGITTHLLLCRAEVPEKASFVMCVFVIVALRLAAFNFDLQLPTLKTYSGRGKSGGARVIYFNVSDETIWLLVVYTKGKFDNLPTSFLMELKQGVEDAI